MAILKTESYRMTDVQDRMRKPILSTSLAAILAFYVVYFGFSDQNPLRPLIYILPIFLAFELLIRRQLRFYPLNFVTFFLFVSVWGTASVANPAVESKEAVFVALSLLVASLVYRTPQWFAPYVIVVGIATVVLKVALNGASLSQFAVGLSSSHTGTETSLGLIVPLATMAVFVRQRWLWTVLGLAVTFLMFKRIAFVAVLIVVVFDFIQYQLFRYSRVGRYFVPVMRLALVAIAVAMGLFPKEIYEFISQAAFSMTGVFISPDAISSGRYNAMSVFLEYLGDVRTSSSIIFGHGAGFSTGFLGVNTYFSDKHFPLLHNDILRLYADFGLIGLSIGTFLLARFSLGTRLQAAFASYTTLLFVTDNVMTYFVYWLVFITLWRGEDMGVQSASAPSEDTR